MNEVLTVEEISALLSLHPVTVRRMAKDGTIPARKMGKEWRFNRATIMDWLNGDLERAKSWQSEKIKIQESGILTYQLQGQSDTKNLASQRTENKRKNSTTK